MSSAAIRTPELHPVPTDPASEKSAQPLSRADRIQDRMKGTVTFIGDIVSPFFKEVEPESDRD